MKQRNGFVFIETMITIVILASALLAIYTLFTNMLISEKRKAYYDDPVYVYRARYLVKVLEDRFKYASTSKYEPGVYNTIEDLLIDRDESGNNFTYYIKSLSCDNDIFNDNYYSSTKDCRYFFHEQKIYRIYISKYDLSYIHTCDSSNSQSCFGYKSIGDQAKRYLKSLSYVPGGDGYYIIFEFEEDGKGNACTNSKCMHEFASIKYGGHNQIVNLND